ncbi:MAG: hypothetical protein HY690_00550 [Chloroflexi bacterium]|nr:hypothetical protein [Chloroflexota bacterium]
MKLHLRRRQPGQVIALAVIVMVAMVGMLAFAVDVGRFWETRRELQNAADAGALAGVSQLPGDPDAANDLALQYADTTATTSAIRLCRETPTHEVTQGTFDLSGGGFVYTLSVTSRCTDDYTFGRVLNLTSMPIEATATASLGSLRVSDCPLPFGVQDLNGDADGDGNWANDGFGYPFGEIVPLKVDESEKGNFHAVDYGDGGKTYREALADCSKGKVLQEATTVPSETGGMTGPTRQGLEDRGLEDCGGPGEPDLCSYNKQYVLACPDNLDDIATSDGELKPGAKSICLGVVPIVKFWEISGKKYMDILGFGLFFITGYAEDGPDKYVEGAFIKGTVLGDIGGYSEYGTTVFRLTR